MSPFLLIKDAFNLFRSFTKCPPTGQDSFQCLNTSTHRMGVQGGSHSLLVLLKFWLPAVSSGWHSPSLCQTPGGPTSLELWVTGCFPLPPSQPISQASESWTIIWTTLSPCSPTPNPQSIHYTSCHGDHSGIPI